MIEWVIEIHQPIERAIYHLWYKAAYGKVCRETNVLDLPDAPVESGFTYCRWWERFQISMLRAYQNNIRQLFCFKSVQEAVPTHNLFSLIRQKTANLLSAIPR